MVTLGPIREFGDARVIIELDPEIPPWRAEPVMLSLRTLVGRYAISRGPLDGLALAIAAAVAEYGLVSRLVGMTADAIEFLVAQN